MTTKVIILFFASPLSDKMNHTCRNDRTEFREYENLYIAILGEYKTIFLDIRNIDT